jgi:hypothetical protein
MTDCGKCGKKIDTNAKFCSNCGNPITNMVPPPPPPEATIQAPAPPPPPPPEPQATVPAPAAAQNTSGEQVTGVLLLRKPKSLGRYDTFTGVVTSQRFIFAQMTSQMITQAVKDAQQQAKAEGKGFFGQWADQLKASFGYTQRYLTMQPAAILAETPGNYAFDNNMISEIKVNHKKIMSGGEVQRHEFEIELKSSMGNSTFKMDENNEYIKTLKATYGEKVKMPFGYFSSGINIKIG